MGIKQEFEAAFLDAMPEQWDRGIDAGNRKLARVLGAALEKVMQAPTQVHIHITSYHTIKIVGGVVEIEPALVEIGGVMVPLHHVPRPASKDI